MIKFTRHSPPPTFPAIQIVRARGKSENEARMMGWAQTGSSAVWFVMTNLSSESQSLHWCQGYTYSLAAHPEKLICRGQLTHSTRRATIVARAQSSRNSEGHYSGHGNVINVINLK